MIMHNSFLKENFHIELCLELWKLTFGDIFNIILKFNFSEYWKKFSVIFIYVVHLILTYLNILL